MKTPILVAFSFFLAIYSASAALLKKAEITAVINEVRLLEANAAERGANVKDVVQGQTAVRTGLQSRSELLFQDKTLTRLGANTFFSFTEGTRDLELEHGTMLLQCPKGVGGAKIRTAAVTAAITGTTILLEYSPAPGPKRAPGYVPTIAKMTADEASAELRHPRRTYTKAERSTLEAQAKQRQKGGSGGYVKVLVLEGTLRLYLNTRVGESVLITAGHMTILDPHAITIPPAVEFDISQLASTSLLVNNKFWGGAATEVNMALVAREVTVQDKLKSHGELLATNLVIPGGGTEVFTLAQLNQSIEAQDIILQTQQNGSAGASGGGGGTGSTPAGGAGPTGSGSPPSSSSSSPLVTISTPDPYVVGPNTTFNTDPSTITNTVPTVTTGSAINNGLAYRNTTLDGPLTDFIFGSTSSFDNLLQFGNYFKDNPTGDANFKFADLAISGPPTINTTAGATALSLIAEGTITSTAPGGTWNLDASPLVGLFMATVNGSIHLGPELSFTSAATYASTGTPVPTNPNTPLDLGLYLELYARGTSSDVILGSNVNFADRDLRIEAERNIGIDGNVIVTPTSPRSYPYFDVSLYAGNLVTLGAGARITTDSLGIIATDVVGSSGALVDAVDLEIILGNVANLTQSGGPLYVNTLPISQTNLQNFYLQGNAGVTVSGNVTTTTTAPNPSSGNFIGLLLGSDAGDVVINGNLTTNNDLLIQTSHNFIVGPGGLVTAHNVEIDSILGGITLPGDATFNTAPNPSGPGNFVGLQINGDGQNTGPTGNIPGPSGDVTINGHLTTNNDLQINTSGNFIMGPGALITANSVQIGSGNLGGITLPGDVTFNTAANPGGNTDFVGLYISGVGGNNGNNIVGDVTVNGHLTTNNAVQFNNGNNNVAGGYFVLGPNGRITAPQIQIDNFIDVMGSGNAVVDGASAAINIQIQNAATLTQSGNLLYVNTLPIDQTSPLQNLFIMANAGVNLPSDISVNTVTGGFFTNFSLTSNGALTINGKLTTSKGVNIQVQSLVVGPLALIQATNVHVEVTDTVDPAIVTVSGNNLIFNSLPIDVSMPNSFAGVSAPTIQVAPNLVLTAQGGVGIGSAHSQYDPDTNTFTGFTVDNVQVPGDITVSNGLNLSGNTTVSGNVDAGGLGLGVLTVAGTVNTNTIFWAGQYSFYNSSGSQSSLVETSSSLTAPVVNAPGGLNFAGANEGSGMGSNNGFPDNGHIFTLNTPTVLFAASGSAPLIGPSTFDGGDALPGGSNEGGSGGTLNVNTTGDITVNTTISASTGANATSVTTGGIGGTVNLNTTNGAVTVNSTVQVSSNDVPNRKVSKQGGNITLQTGKTSSTGIQVTNTGQLLSLLNATAPGPGGTVQLISAGADISVDGKIQADKGTIDVHNNGAAGNVAITSNAQLSADVIKAGALGANGQLTISAGSQINANTLLKLYGGTGASGLVLFTGAGNVNISGSQIHIAATTVQVGSSTHVNNSGSTFVHATNHNYGIGAGGGNFQNPVTAGPLTGAPPY